MRWSPRIAPRASRNCRDRGMTVVGDDTIGAALAAAASGLAAAGVDSPRLDARVLLAHVLGAPPEAISVHARAPLDARARARFDAALARRERHEPVAYIVGHKEFWSLRF